MVATVSVSPAVAMLRLAPVLGVTSVPRYLGSCGRLSVMDGDLTPLTHHLTHTDLSTRAELGSQVMTMVSTLLTAQPDAMTLVWNMTMQDLAVSSSGQLVLTGLDKMTPVDKRLLTPDTGDRSVVCNDQCFDQFRSRVMMATPRGQPGGGCAEAVQYSDMMYRDVCTNVLSTMFSDTGELGRLIRECREEEGVGGRWRTVDTLVALLEKMTKKQFDDINESETEDSDFDEDNVITTTESSGEEHDDEEESSSTENMYYHTRSLEE